MKKFLLAILFFILSATTLFAQYQDLYFADPQSWGYSTATITENTFSVKDKGFFYEVNLYLSFKATNPSRFDSDAQIEMVSYFNLPEDYAISNLWLWVGDQIMEARIYDKWTAQRIYEDIVDRRKDPALLIKNGPRSYELRIYPFKPDQERKIRLSFLIPQNRSQDAVQLQLPNQIQQLAEEVTVNPNVIYWSDSAEPDIEISGYESLEFESDIANGAQYWSAEIPVTNTYEDITMSRSLNNETTKIQIFDDGNEKYYNLSFFPSEIFKSEQAINALILIDYNSNDTDSFLNTLKAEMKAQFGPQDRFNILISDFSVQAISDQWLIASDSVIDSTFNNIDTEDIGNLSNLDNLLTEGIEFIRNGEIDADILLASNSQQYSSVEDANDLLDAFFDFLEDDKISISVSDIREDNFEYHWAAGRNYYGNEYLYENLSRDTGGEFFSLYREGSSSTSIIKSGLSSLQTGISSPEVHFRSTDGFTYGRYSNMDNSNWVYLNNNVTQVGKFVGEAPFTIEFNGFYRDSVIYDELTVTSDQIGSTDSTLKRYWSAKRIHELESEDPSNAEITEIIDLSMDNRILSRYTAFLALEPSDTVKACASCFDETELTSNEEDLLPESFEVDSLAAYPNPFNPAVNIQVNLAKAWDASNSSLEIFNILGQSVAKLNTDAFNGQKSFQVRWNVQDSGSISSGVYIVRLRTPNSMKTMKITYMK